MTSFVHVAPQLPPAIDGVGDYCWNLWRHWPDRDANWHFAALNNADATSQHWREVNVHGFQPNVESLHATLEKIAAPTAVLHYVGYGFQPKGIPLWLPAALARWRCRSFDRRLVVMFHEMYARSSPLRSPFWVGPWARKIIRELVAQSDAWATNCERHFDQLVTDFSASPEDGRMIPVGSNIALSRPFGSPPPNVGPDESKFRIVVFGLAGTRLWALERHWKLLRALAHVGLVDSVTLLGKRHEPADERAWQSIARKIGPNVNWRKCFDLSSDEISRELSGQHLGLLANEPDVLTKSGVFAALAEHGVIPVVSTRPGIVSPRPRCEAVLLNDDGESIPTLVETLRDNIRVANLCEHLLAFAGTELAWPRIAQSWREVVELAAESQGELKHELFSKPEIGANASFGEPVARV